MLMRKTRYILEIKSLDGSKSYLEPIFVKLSAPIDELHTEKNEITFTIYGIGTEESKKLTTFYAWIASGYDLNGNYKTVEKGIGYLKSVDGAGNILDDWELVNVHITSITFGELDYSSSDKIDITATMHYDQCRQNQKEHKIIPSEVLKHLD